MSTMTRDEAARTIANRSSDARILSRMSQAALKRVHADQLRQAGRSRLFGQSSKDELINEILELRWPPDGQNEAIHVLYHVDGLVNSACEHCPARGEDQ